MKIAFALYLIALALSTVWFVTDYIRGKAERKEAAEYERLWGAAVVPTHRPSPRKPSSDAGGMDAVDIVTAAVMLDIFL